jgi:hypothetical protein
LSDLRNLVDLVRHNASIPELVGLFAVLSAEAADPAHPAHDYFTRRYERARSAMREALVRARDAGLLASGVDLDHEARALVALLDGLQIQWLLAPDAVDMARELSAELQQLLVVPLDVQATDAVEGESIEVLLIRRGDGPHPRSIHQSACQTPLNPYS